MTQAMMMPTFWGRPNMELKIRPMALNWAAAAEMPESMMKKPAIMRTLKP